MFGKRRARIFDCLAAGSCCPIILILAITAAATGYYYWRVTGSPFRMTYQVNRGHLRDGAIFPVAVAPARTRLSPRGDARFLPAGIQRF